MNTIQIQPGLWLLQASVPEFRGFAGTEYIEDGLGYNSYLLDTGKGFASFGTLPERFQTEWIGEIRSIAGNDLKWAVFHGTEHDRSSACVLNRQYPDCRILGGKNTLFRITSCMQKEYPFIELRNNRTLDLGGKQFLFQVLQETSSVPCIYAVDQADGILFSADAFGSFCAQEQERVSRLSDKKSWLPGAEKYIREIRGDERTEGMAWAVDLVHRHEISMICPSAGPVVDDDIDALLSLYQKKKEDKNSLVIAYRPEEYLPEMAELIRAGAVASGITDVKLVDLSVFGRDKALEIIRAADACLFGTTDRDGEASKAIWDILTSLRKKECSGRPAAVFSSYSVQKDAAETLRNRMIQLGFELNQSNLSVQGIPDKAMLDNIYEYGFGFGCLLRKIPNPHKPTLVKCLVCGEIFEASLGVCPVCRVGLDQCIPVEADATSFRKDTESTYLILGGGIAAVSAAEAIRQRDRTGTITILSAESYLPINRPMLTKDLDVTSEGAESIQIHPQSWYEERGIEVQNGILAAALHPEEKYVLGSNGIRYGYDKLICATGAECFVPPFAGHDKGGVITIRHLEDVHEIKQRMKEGAKQAVVIGGGVLGLEAANELMRSGIQVTVLEAAPQIIGRQIDPLSAQIIKEKMNHFGIPVFEGVSIAEIEGDEQAAGVRLGDGRSFPADFVVVSCGNRANAGFMKTAGASVERAVVVNEFMESAIPDVYACGDCCQFENLNYQLWQEAGHQGRIAGANAAGERLSYANQMFGLSMEGFGTSLYAIGDTGKRDEIPYKTVETRDEVTGRFEKYWFFGGALQGAVLIGTQDKIQTITEAVTTHARYQEIF